MLNWRFWSNTISNQQNLEHYMNLQTDPLDNLLRTHPIQMGWEISSEVYLNWQFRGIDDPGCQFGDGSVPTETRTRSDGLEPLLTLASTNNSSSYSIHWPPSNYLSCSDVPSQSSLMTLPSDTEILYHYDHTILSNVVTPQPSSLSWSIIFPPLHNMLTPSPYLPQSPPFRNINPCPLHLHIAQLSHWTISRKPGWSQYPHPRSEVLRELVPKIPASLDDADGIDPLPANHLRASLVLKLSCRNPSIRYGAVSDSNISNIRNALNLILLFSIIFLGGGGRTCCHSIGSSTARTYTDTHCTWSIHIVVGRSNSQADWDIGRITLQGFDCFQSKIRVGFVLWKCRMLSHTDDPSGKFGDGIWVRFTYSSFIS